MISGHRYENRAVDMCCCGVIIYVMMMMNYFQWRAANQAQMSRQILTGDFQIPDSVSVLCTDLIRKLMTIDRHVRLTADEGITHPWLDTIKVTWDQDDCLVPHLSRESFTRTLRSTESKTIANEKGSELLIKRSRVVHLHSFKPARSALRLVSLTVRSAVTGWP
jgi:serine/threonine protein kinase